MNYTCTCTCTCICVYVHVHVQYHVFCSFAVTGSVPVGDAARGYRVHGKGHGVQGRLAACQDYRTESNRIKTSGKPQNYRIAGNFRGGKLSRIGRKGAFRGENFRGTSKLVA